MQDSGKCSTAQCLFGACSMQLVFPASQMEFVYCLPQTTSELERELQDLKRILYQDFDVHGYGSTNIAEQT